MPRPTGTDNYVGFEIECFGFLTNQQLKKKLDADPKVRGKFDIVYDGSLRPPIIERKKKKGDLRLKKKEKSLLVKYNPVTMWVDKYSLKEVKGKEGLFFNRTIDAAYYEEEYDGKRWSKNGKEFYPSKKYLSGENNWTDRNFHYYYAKKDYYTAGGKRTNGYEVRLLCKQKELNSIVNKVFFILNENDIGVNHSCGLHIHLDMRNRNRFTAYKNLFQCQDAMFSVNKGRQRNQYCRKNTSNSYTSQNYKGGRYWAINTKSYSRHKTIEIRMGKATMNAEEVIAWARMLTTIVDKKSEVKTRVKTLGTFLKTFKMSDTNTKALRKMQRRKAA